MSFGIINHNVSAVNTFRQLQLTSGFVNKSLERLSSGLRINRAADDAAGLAVSEHMRTQIFGLDQANRNANDAIAMIQTGEGVLDTTQSMIQRMRKLAIQAANDTYTTYDRQSLQKEIDQLINEVDHIAEYTEFNTKKLLNGDALGSASTSDPRIASASVVGEVANADYQVTILDAGTASNVHGNANLQDGTDADYIVNMRDAGIFGTQELHIVVDGQTRVVAVNEDDTLEDVKSKINRANIGVLAGLDVEGNDLTITSMRSGSKFNISFGDDPDGVAAKLGLFGGLERTLTYSTVAVDSNGASLGHSVFTSGTDTIISITNITLQTIFPTDPGTANFDGSPRVGMYGTSLGIFRSSSDIFTEKELSNPINGMSIVTKPSNQGGTLVTNVPGVGIYSIPATATAAAISADIPDLTQSTLLKGFTIHIDEQLDYGVLQRDERDADPAGEPDTDGWTGYFPDPFNNGDLSGIPQDDHRARVPTEREISLPSAAIPTAGTPAAAQEASITQFILAVRDRRQHYHVGAAQNHEIIVGFANMSAEALGLKISMRSDGHYYDGVEALDNGARTVNYSLNVTVESQKSAENAIGIFDAALAKVSEERAKLGAFQNGLEKAVNYLDIAYENQVASESRIRDVDMAREISELTKNQVLVQSGTAMLAQSNLKPQTVLSLLG